MAHDVFISHSAKDKTIADAVCATLERKGIRCWIAPRDIVPGKQWGEAIIDAIGASRVMVLLFSSNANESQQIVREVERAVNKGIPVVPFRVEDVDPNKSLEYYISAPHWLDALTPPLESHVEKLANTIRLLLSESDSKPPKDRAADYETIRPQPGGANKEGGSAGKWAGLVVLLLLVAAGAYYFMGYSEDVEKNESVAVRQQDDYGDIVTQTRPPDTISRDTQDSNEYYLDPVGSPGLFFWQNIVNGTPEQCMKRAEDAFESEGMKIGNGDYWWLGASEPRYHGYNVCLDAGNGQTFVHFAVASWRYDTQAHLQLLTSAYNSPPGTLDKKAPFTGSVPRRIPELYMWVQKKRMTQIDCLKRATEALRSEGLQIAGSDTYWVGGADARFNTYVTCTDLGNGFVYVNVTSASSEKEDIGGHRDRISRQFD